jgi:hypothetical protein
LLQAPFRKLKSIADVLHLAASRNCSHDITTLIMEIDMRISSFRIFALAAAGIALQVSPAASGLENCYSVRATADARNQAVSRERAEHRLHRHIADEMRSAGGKSVGPTHVHCIRNACEASAWVCRH